MFRNEAEILDNATSDSLRRLRRDAMYILKSAVDAVDPGDAIRRRMMVEGSRLSCDGFEIDLEHYSRVFVVGGGKAGGAMSEAVEGLLGDRVSGGAVNVLKGTEDSYRLQNIRLYGASHPIPDERSLRGVEAMLSILEGVGEDDLLIVLISGGGSALMTYPAKEVGVGDVKKITDRLLKSGATINELNAVRKHISAVKGGQMVKRARPATVLSLILSDVVGDPIDAIASGPTAPDTTTFQDAVSVLKDHGIWESTPESIRNRLLKGASGEIEETPKPGDATFEKVHNFVIGSNLLAAKAAVEMAQAFGYNSILLSTRLEGEARRVGTVLAGIAGEIALSGYPLRRPAAVIAGGETTVTVLGSGEGGRNQELALSAASKIMGLDVVIATLATDGIDGPTEAAGAIADGATMERAESMGLEAVKSLADNDSHGFFKGLGDALITGPTGTNVNDLTLILVSD